MGDFVGLDVTGALVGELVGLLVGDVVGFGVVGVFVGTPV